MLKIEVKRAIDWRKQPFDKVNPYFAYLGNTEVGRGPDAKTAREIGKRNIQHFVTSQTEIYRHRNYCAIVRPSLYGGWEYDTFGCEISGRCWLGAAHTESIEMARRLALLQLAFQTRRDGETTSEILGNDQDREQFARDARNSDEWHGRYRFARQALGMSENDSRDYAGRNPARSDIWRDKPQPNELDAVMAG